MLLDDESSSSSNMQISASSMSRFYTVISLFLLFVKDCLALWEGSEKRGEVNYLNTITASNNVHPSPASSLCSHPVHTFGSAFLPDWPNDLSFQSGPSLHRLQTWAASITTSTILPAYAPCPLFSSMCLTSAPSGCRWAGLDSQASGGVKRPNLPGRMLSK